MAEKSILFSGPMIRAILDCDSFEMPWNNLNASRGYGWDTNPRVFVYEFEVINGV